MLQIRGTATCADEHKVSGFCVSNSWPPLSSAVDVDPRPSSQHGVPDLDLLDWMSDENAGTCVR